MRENFLWKRQFRGHQKRWPVYGVKAQDVLAHQMQIGWTQIVALHRAHVGNQRIEPDVKHVWSVHGRRNPPLDIGTRDGKIVQALPDKRDDFVAAVIRLYELRIFFVELQQSMLKCR